MEGLGTTNMNRDKMLCLRKTWTKDQSDAVSNIKDAHKDMLSVKNSRSAVENNKAELGSVINLQIITQKVIRYYIFNKEFDCNKDRYRRTHMEDLYDHYEQPKQAQDNHRWTL